MSKTMKIVAAGAAIAGLAAGGAAIATAGSEGDSEQPIAPGADLERAEAAALDHTGGGTVTDTEVGDEESRYEVEVTLDDGSQVDVQLDGGFDVVGEEAETGEGDEPEPAGS